MLTSKLCRMLFSAAIVSSTCQFSFADCNCSLPPAPSAQSGIVTNAPPMAGGGYGAYGYSGYSPGSMTSSAWGNSPYVAGNYDTAGPHWAPGGYEARVGSPVYYHDPAGGQYVVSGNPYNDHFGPGFQRNSLQGHYRFPYYNYRAPWYYPGKSVYNRDTNFAW